MIIKILIGVLVVSGAVLLMVWGQKYLGEEKGRNPKNPNEKGTGESPCGSCNACRSTESEPEKTGPEAGDSK